MGSGGFVDGFATGYSLIDRTMGRKENQQLARDKMAQDQQQFSQRFGLSQQNHDLAQEQFKQNKLNQDRSFEMRQKEYDNQNRLFDLETERAKLETQKARNDEAMQYLRIAADGVDIGDKGRSAINNSTFAPYIAQTDSERKQAVDYFSRYDNLKTPEELMQFANAPQTRKYLETYFNNELYPREKATGMKYEISRVVPVPGGVNVNFNVYDRGGNLVKQNVPATSGRGDGKDETIMSVPIKDFKQKVMSGINLQRALIESPAMRRSLGMDAPDKMVKLGLGDSLVNARTGQTVASNEKPAQQYTPAQASAALKRIYDKYMTLGGAIDEKNISNEDRALIRYLEPLAYPGKQDVQIKGQANQNQQNEVLPERIKMMAGRGLPIREK